MTFVSTVWIAFHLIHSAVATLPKIGTWEKNYKTYWVGLNGAYTKTASKREEVAFLRAFRNRIEDYLLPPQQFTIYEMRSEFLGLVGLVVDTPASLPAEEEIKAAVYVLSRRWKTEFNIKFRRDNRGGDGKDSNIEQRDNAPHDLVSLSTPPGVSAKQMQGIFWQWKNPGDGVTVYVMDTGCDSRHPEFKNTKFQDWIFPGPETLEEPRDDSDLPESNDFHGTPVTAKIVGEKTGVAQNAIVVVANIIAGNARQGFGHDLYKAHDCLLKIYDHVKENNPGGTAKCVINISYGWIPLDHLKSIDARWAAAIELHSRYIFTELVNLGCYFVMASGNSGKEVTTDLIFAHAADPKLMGNTVVVGGHDFDLRNVYDYGGIVTISAEARNLIVARGYPMSMTPSYGEGWDSSSTWKVGHGTSFASPVVAGLLATFLSFGLGDPVRLLHTFAKKPPYPGQAKIAFNGIYADQWPKSLRPEGYTRNLKNP
ncbi:hypothetical protein TWF225_008278 [Orbilia oligospora]|uniref:Uncharacterized protein n=1 Tax=Orbilia oligospora TaxID=2813651 RepID=A0A7C8UAF7_ORBOL|nr:hypothetical protein TWF751_000195 [Orbilia oligospora]KAF3194106.1 hypothetical protein TWF225_008278 [Orbilia oligospora]KAF3269004.1 hypothetical protein TWF217_010283 [Orbilia oligospora]TGJ67649.1 hypothetical protein EYR41_006763 [Orbilia oligospora]